MWRNQNPHTLFVAKCYSLLGNTWLFLKMLYTPIPLLYTYPKERDTYPNKNLYVNGLSSIIHNSQKVETAECSGTYTPLITLFRRLRQKDYMFQANLNDLVRPCFKIKK